MCLWRKGEAVADNYKKTPYSSPGGVEGEPSSAKRKDEGSRETLNHKETQDG